MSNVRYKREYDEIARWACIQGATNERLAAILRVTVQTVDNWIKKQPTFREAVHHGRHVATAEIAGKLYTLATGYTKRRQVAHKVKTVEYSDSGKKLREVERIEVMELEEDVGPEMGAIAFYLKNRDSENWRDRWDHKVEAGDGLAAFLTTIAEASSHIPPHLQGKDSTPA